MKKTKKMLALILAVLMLMSSLSVAGVVAQAAEKYPTVYISGYGRGIYAEKGNLNSEQYYPTGADVGAIVKEAIAPCLKELAIGAATGNFDKYCDELYNAVHPIYEDLCLAPDGTPKDNSGSGEKLSSVHMDYSRFSGGEDGLPYDWRLSPETIADDLETFIDNMLRKTGAKKVNIVGRCLGGNVLSAYLQNHKDHAKANVNEVVLFIPSTEGMNMLGALFSGKIEIVAENIDTYAEEFFKYESLIEDAAVRDLITVMLTIFEQATVLGLGTDALQMLIDEIKDNLVPRLIRRTYGSFPSFWSMVPADYLEDALAFVYNTPELKEEYEGTIAKARSYRDNVMLNARDCIKELSGVIEVNVISKYNLPLPPIFADCNITSDGFAETYYTSFGATTTDFGKNLSADYIANMSDEDKKFLSPDEKIDASTCVLPEYTWFVKNSYHDHFPESFDILIETMLTTDDMTVFSNGEYPQFLEETGAEKLVAVEGKDKEKPAEGSDEAKTNMLVKFVLAIINFFKKLFGIA